MLLLLAIALSLVLPVRAGLGAADPYLQHGRLMEAAIRHRDLRQVRTLLRSPYVTPDGYRNERGRFVPFIPSAVGSHDRDGAVLALLLGAGATELGAGCRGQVLGPMLLHRWTRHAELLLQYQVLHVDDRACVGQRPPVLHWVARYIAQEDATAFLLDHGAHVDAPDESGHTALHVAVEMRHIAVVRRLLESSARVDAASAYGFRPIDYTYQYGDGRTQCVLRTQRTDADREIESVLLGAGARPATPCAPGAACVCSGNRY